jgi:nuclear transport factor 2 (NTF2) superfamily protein
MLAETRQPLPHFTQESAIIKVSKSEDVWNSCVIGRHHMK